MLKNCKIVFYLMLVAVFNSCNSKTIHTEEKIEKPPLVNMSKPNIILILADDMGYSDIGCYGGEIKTPNLDQLAENGIRFTQFYNAARCCPTRASLISGVYPHQAGMGGMVKNPEESTQGPYQGYLNKNSVTIAEVLKDAGYYTAASGKWHVGEERPHWPTDRGFDNYYGLISGGANYFDITKTKRAGIKRHFAIDSTEHMPPNEGFYMTDAITENAVGFLDTASVKNKPFFLYIPYTAPHWPLHAKQEDIAKYRGKYMTGWDVLRQERYERMVKMGIIDKTWGMSERNQQVTSWGDLDDEQKDRMDLLMSIYAAQVDCLDKGIGQVLSKLEAIGASDNTIIMFLSDNGGSEETGPFGQDFWGNFWDGEAIPGSADSYHSYGGSWANLSNTPFRKYKKRTHEGGIATPFIVKWPKGDIVKGSLNHHPAHITDIMATICDVAEAKYPETYKGNTIVPLQGKSLKPYLTGESNIQPRTLYWEHSGNRAIRKGDWKLVSMKDNPWELYDLSKDRSETTDLIKNNSEIATEMKGLFEKWADKVGVRQ